MGMSKQTTFTLTFLVGLSVIVPGCAGYLAARMDAVEQAHRELLSLESRIRQERLVTPTPEAVEWDQGQTVAVPGTVPCKVPSQAQRRRREEPVPAALIPVPAGLPPGEAPAAGSPPAGAGQKRQRTTDHERRRRHRERQEQTGVPGQGAADRESPPYSSQRAPDEDGIAGFSQAEAPTN